MNNYSKYMIIYEIGNFRIFNIFQIVKCWKFLEFSKLKIFETIQIEKWTNF